MAGADVVPGAGEGDVGGGDGEGALGVAEDGDGGSGVAEDGDGELGGAEDGAGASEATEVGDGGLGVTEVAEGAAEVAEDVIGADAAAAWGDEASTLRSLTVPNILDIRASMNTTLAARTVRRSVTTMIHIQSVTLRLPCLCPHGQTSAADNDHLFAGPPWSSSPLGNPPSIHGVLGEKCERSGSSSAIGAGPRPGVKLKGTLVRESRSSKFGILIVVAVMADWGTGGRSGREERVKTEAGRSKGRGGGALRGAVK